MAGYNEYKTNEQSNIVLGETLKMAVKAPAVADRIFNTLEDAENYISDNYSSAIAGLVISVINDIYANNGVYFVNRDDITQELALVKLGTSGTSRYVHDQAEPSDEWHVTHNLHCFPSVTVVDTANSIVEGSVEYVDLDNMTIYFNSVFSGFAYIN